MRGTFEIVGQDGERIESERRTVALCRCGKSRIRPFCDGTHRSANFKAAGTAEGAAAIPTRPPAPVRVAQRCLVPGDGNHLSREAADFDEPLSQAVAWTCLAHEVLVTLLARPVGATEYLALRVAEPLVRSASALVETRRLQPPPSASEELVRGGLPAAESLVAAAVEAIARHGDDPILGTAHGLLSDAKRELEMGRRR